MHACSLGLFLVTTALQPLAGGCTKYVMGHPMPENMAKIVYKIVHFLSASFAYLNSSLLLSEKLLRQCKYTFDWYRAAPGIHLSSWRISPIRLVFMKGTVPWKCLKQDQTVPYR